MRAEQSAFADPPRACARKRAPDGGDRSPAVAEAYPRSMRNLRLSWSRASGAVPFLVAATVMPAACGGNIATSSTSAGGGGAATNSTGTGATNTGGTGTGGAGGFVFTGGGGTGGTGGTADLCSQGPVNEYTFTVALPEPGVPAEPGQICAQNPPSVASNTAARVTLTKYSQALNLAMGLVSIAPDLQATVMGTPAIEVVSAGTNALLGMVVSDVQPVQGGFTFHAEWPQMLNLPPESWVNMTVKTTFTSQCGPGPNDVRTVEALTIIHLCFEGNELVWVSSGDECKVCEIIAEMAPSPIVPDKREDDLPLARALRLRVRPVVKIGRSVVLMAENDGGPDVEYAWRASGGEVQSIAPDVVVWTPPREAGPHLLQAAVTGEHTAGVASYTLEAA